MVRQEKFLQQFRILSDQSKSPSTLTRKISLEDDDFYQEDCKTIDKELKHKIKYDFNFKNREGFYKNLLTQKKVIKGLSSSSPLGLYACLRSARGETPLELEGSCLSSRPRTRITVGLDTQTI